LKPRRCATRDEVSEGDELLAPRRVHRELEGGLDRFGAAVGEVRLRRRGDGHNLVELARKVRHVAVVVIRAAHVYESRGLFLYGADDFGVAVAC
jgi:hypothetical protein